MRKKILRPITLLMTLIILLSLVLSACTPAATTTPEATEEAAMTEEPAATEPPAGETLAVGIVLPTKDEPRWIQDETRFREALGAAGYDVEILFSQGYIRYGKIQRRRPDHQGHQSADHLPAGWHSRGRRC